MSLLSSEGDAVAAFGFFQHRAKPTGLTCETDWCARFRVVEERIRTYHFLEDSYAIARAFRRSGHRELAVDGGHQTVPDETRGR